MKKYKQLYKYSDCVITNLHIIQHTRWTFFFIHIATMHLTKWKIKKDFFCFFLFLFFLLFFCTQHTPNGISCGWGKKLQVYSWVWTRCMVSGSMSCFDRILQGHNHDLIASTNGLEPDWTASPQWEMDACKTSSHTSWEALSCQTPWSSSSSLSAHHADAENKFPNDMHWLQTTLNNRKRLWN